MQKIVDWKLPIKTVSEANSNEHWSKKLQRHKRQKHWIWVFFQDSKPNINLPCIVKMIRCSPRQLDSDNLQMAFKWIRDAISEQIFPGSLAGRADNHPSIKWEYEQEKSKLSITKIEIHCEV